MISPALPDAPGTWLGPPAVLAPALGHGDTRPDETALAALVVP